MSDSGKSRDDRAPIAKAIDTVSRVFTASLAFALPPYLGNILDKKYAAGQLFTLIGLVVGLLAGGWLLYKLTIQVKPNK